MVKFHQTGRITPFKRFRVPSRPLTLSSDRERQSCQSSRACQWRSSDPSGCWSSRLCRRPLPNTARRELWMTDKFKKEVKSTYFEEAEICLPATLYFNKSLTRTLKSAAACIQAVFGIPGFSPFPGFHLLPSPHVTVSSSFLYVDKVPVGMVLGSMLKPWDASFMQGSRESLSAWARPCRRPSVKCICCVWFQPVPRAAERLLAAAVCGSPFSNTCPLILPTRRHGPSWILPGGDSITSFCSD